jgi:hypothetical protein
MSEGSSSEVSEYNDAKLSIARLHNQWIKAEYHASKGDLKNWKFILDSIWRELSPDVLRKFGANSKHQKQNLSSMGKVAKSESRNQLYFNLNQRHEFLRHIQDIIGKAGRYVDEDYYSFE